MFCHWGLKPSIRLRLEAVCLTLKQFVMLKKIFTLSLLLAATVVVFSSCTKSGVFTNENDVTGTWAVTAIRSNIANDWDGDGYSETNIYATYSTCQRDIVLILNYDGSGKIRQGCNANWQNLGWQLRNSNALYISIPDGDLNLDNLRVGANTIQGDDNVYSNGRNYTITYTLQRR